MSRACNMNPISKSETELGTIASNISTSSIDHSKPEKKSSIRQCSVDELPLISLHLQPNKSQMNSNLRLRSSTMNSLHLSNSLMRSPSTCSSIASIRDSLGTRINIPRDYSKEIKELTEMKDSVDQTIKDLLNEWALANPRINLKQNPTEEASTRATSRANRALSWPSSSLGLIVFAH